MHAYYLPETAPTNIVLAQVLQLRRLDDQLVHLVQYVQLFIFLEVSPRQLLLHPLQHLYSPLVLTLRFLLLTTHAVDGLPIRPEGSCRTVGTCAWAAAWNCWVPIVGSYKLRRSDVGFQN